MHYTFSLVLRHHPTSCLASVVLVLLSLVQLTLFVKDDAGSPELPIIHIGQHAMLYNPEAAQCHLSCATSNVGFQKGYAVALLVWNPYEAKSLQLLLTACCLAHTVLNIWNYFRLPSDCYPVVDLPCRSGIFTRWNNRPCSDAHPLIPKESDPLIPMGCRRHSIKIMAPLQVLTYANQIKRWRYIRRITLC